MVLFVSPEWLCQTISYGQLWDILPCPYLLSVSVFTSYWQAKMFASIAKRKGASFFPGKDSNNITIETIRTKATQLSSVFLHVELKLYSF